jgi:hypothetical protein
MLDEQQSKNKVVVVNYCRETRDGWPLLTVETEVDGDSKSTNERGSSLGSLCRYKRLYPALAALFGPVQNIFSSAYTI